MPRKATGQLVWRPSGYFARYWTTVEGERKQLFRALETKNEILARRRMAQLANSEAAAVAAPLVETFAQATERVHEVRARSLAGARTEISFLRTHALPVLGRMPVNEISKADVVSVLEAVRDAGLADQTILHVRNAIAAVFKHLRREGIVRDLPVPTSDELPECLPEAIDDRPKAVLSDDELLVYLAYTPEGSKTVRGAVRERQVMALLSRCVGGLRTNELSGLTWARAHAESGRFDALEVVRYKTRRKAARRGSKTAARQLYPLGDTVLPAFLRYWWMRSGNPSGNAFLFPVRRPKTMQNDRTGERRGKTTWARALRRDVERAFAAAHKAGVPGVAAPGSRRWLELFEGTEDRRPLWFHSSRNAAAISAERVERNKAAAKFTGHSVEMAQHYRERAGEVDVVLVSPELLPDAERLTAVLRAWCEADEVDVELALGGPESAPGKRTRDESDEKARSTFEGDDSQVADITQITSSVPSLGARCRRFESVHPDHSDSEQYDVSRQRN